MVYKNIQIEINSMMKELEHLDYFSILYRNKLREEYDSKGIMYNSKKNYLEYFEIYNMFRQDIENFSNKLNEVEQKKSKIKGFQEHREQFIQVNLCLSEVINNFIQKIKEFHEILGNHVWKKGEKIKNKEPSNQYKSTNDIMLKNNSPVKLITTSSNKKANHEENILIRIKNDIERDQEINEIQKRANILLEIIKKSKDLLIKCKHSKFLQRKKSFSSFKTISNSELNANSSSIDIADLELENFEDEEEERMRNRRLLMILKIVFATFWFFIVVFSISLILLKAFGYVGNQY